MNKSRKKRVNTVVGIAGIAIYEMFLMANMPAQARSDITETSTNGAPSDSPTKITQRNANNQGENHAVSRQTGSRFSDPPVYFAPEDFGKFDAMMSSLGSQANVAVLAEGEPLMPTLPEDARKTLTTALSSPDADRRVSVAASVVAAAWDYDALRIDEHTLLLRKRFTNPDDLPFVTYDEAVYDFNAVLKSIAPFNPPIIYPTEPDSPLVRCIIDAGVRLGTEQLRHGVALTQFGPADRQVLIDSALSCFSGPAANPAREILSELASIRSDTSEFRYFDLLGRKMITVFGFQGPFIYGLHKQKFHEFALSHQLVFDINGEHEWHSGTAHYNLYSLYDIPIDQQTPKYEAWAHRLLTQLKDPGAPGPGDYKSQRPSTATVTLAELIAMLNARATKSAITVAVNPMLAPKTVSIYHSELLSPVEVLRGVAQLYGLRVQTRTGGVTYLTMLPGRPVRSLEEVGSAVEQMIPEPYLRAYRAGARRESNAIIAQRQKEADQGGCPVYSSDELSVRLSDGPRASQTSLFEAAAHRLRVLVEPKVKVATDLRYPMSGMTEEEKRLFALIWTSEFFRAMNEFLQHSDPPRSLKDISNFYVIGDLPTASRPWIGIFTGYKDTDRVHADAGFQVPPPPGFMLRATATPPNNSQTPTGK